jgi:hypothetical protein
MPRFDEVARLKELEQKATPGKWYKGEMDEGDCDEINGRMQGWETGVMVYDRELGIFHPTNEIDNLVTVCSPDQESDADLIANLRNAAPWLLEAAACFQPGDAELLHWMRTAEGDVCDGTLEEVHDAIESLLTRMEKAAEIMEGQE